MTPFQKRVGEMYYIDKMSVHTITAATNRHREDVFHALGIYKAERDRKPLNKTRHCLYCRTEFKIEWKDNWICSHCKPLVENKRGAFA